MSEKGDLTVECEMQICDYRARFRDGVEGSSPAIGKSSHASPTPQADERFRARAHREITNTGSSETRGTTGNRSGHASTRITDNRSGDIPRQRGQTGWQQRESQREYADARSNRASTAASGDEPATRIVTLGEGTHEFDGGRSSSGVRLAEAADFLGSEHGCDRAGSIPGYGNC